MYASTPNYQDALKLQKIIQKKGRMTSKPFKTILNKQKVWTIWYSGKPLGPNYPTKITKFK